MVLVVPPLLCDPLSHPGGHTDEGGGEEEGGRQVEGVVPVTRVVHQPASYRGAWERGQSTSLSYITRVIIIILPTRAAKPLTKVRVPKPEVRRSRPHISTMAGEVTAHQADRKAPNIAETTTKLS